MTRQLLLSLTILSVSMSHLATAHHSRSNFSDDKITVEGVVVAYEWANPHVYFTVDVTSGSGEMHTWNIETHNTMVLVRRHGWSADTLKPGDSVIVNGSPDKNPGRLYIFGDWMIKKDTGERYAINGPGAGSTSEPPRYSLNRIDGKPDFRGAWEMVPPPGGFGRIPDRDVPADLPLTEKGQAAAATFDRDNIAAGQCLSTPLPAYTRFGMLEVERQDASGLGLRNEVWDIRRSVSWGDSVPSAPEPALLGHSVAHWEGDTLVVETAGFLPRPDGNGRGIPSGTEKRVVERFTLEDDGNRLNVVTTNEDPEYLAETIAQEHNLRRTDATLVEYGECDPEVAQRYTQPD